MVHQTVSQHQCRGNKSCVQRQKRLDRFLFWLKGSSQSNFGSKVSWHIRLMTGGAFKLYSCANVTGWKAPTSHRLWLLHAFIMAGRITHQFFPLRDQILLISSHHIPPPPDLYRGSIRLNLLPLPPWERERMSATTICVPGLWITLKLKGCIPKPDTTEW